MIRPLLPFILLSLGTLAACMAPTSQNTATRADINQARQAPKGAPDGTCWHRQVHPAVIETITDQVMVRPPEFNPDGTTRIPASYRTRTRQQIVRERSENWFQTPCPVDLGPDFTASLQRALQARGLYHGLITGRLNERTRQAIRAYQSSEGPDSPFLSLKAARELGLVAVDRNSLS